MDNEQIPPELLKILQVGVVEGVLEYFRDLPRSKALGFAADCIRAINKESLLMKGIAAFLEEIASETPESSPRGKAG